MVLAIFNVSYDLFRKCTDRTVKVGLESLVPRTEEAVRKRNATGF
ncbi:protein of unknown function [Chryseobacterium sp. JV274]|nr:protein of unknown function [Chryseobacterium sp. JV274]